jgi:hypothetical protein
MKIDFFWQNFEIITKVSNLVKFYAEGQTHMTMLLVALHNFANAPKILK